MGVTRRKVNWQTYKNQKGSESLDAALFRTKSKFISINYVCLSLTLNNIFKFIIKIKKKNVLIVKPVNTDTTGSVTGTNVIVQNKHGPNFNELSPFNNSKLHTSDNVCQDLQN